MAIENGTMMYSYLKKKRSYMSKLSERLRMARHVFVADKKREYVTLPTASATLYLIYI